jgi:EpsI family protein
MLKITRLSLRTCAFVALAMVAAAALAMVATPRFAATEAAPSLEATVPKVFGDWRAVEGNSIQVSVSQGVETSFEQPYDQTVLRTYVNSQGDQIMLALAWGERQRQDVKVHRPEVCYPAQGYVVRSLHHETPIAVAGRTEPVPTMGMLAGRGGKGGELEAVRYWIRIGTNYTGDGLRARWYILQEGLNGRVVDGVLVRASQRIHNEEEASRANVLMAQFLSELTQAVPPATLAMLVR